MRRHEAGVSRPVPCVREWSMEGRDVRDPQIETHRTPQLSEEADLPRRRGGRPNPTSRAPDARSGKLVRTISR